MHSTGRPRGGPGVVPMVNFIELSLPVIFAGSVVLFIGAGLVGRLAARRVRAGDGGGPSVTTLHSAVLGMLALMIGFTFAMALSRHEARRTAMIEEANAISTVALRARLLPAPHAAESLALIKDYIDTRVEYTGTLADRAAVEGVIARSDELQEALWQIAMKVAATNGSAVPSGVYITALNEMFDIQTSRVAATFAHIPTVVFLAIYLIAAVSCGFTGYTNGIEGHRVRPSSALMAALIAAVILLVHDLDRPGRGFIRVDRQPMIDTAETIAGYRA